MNTKPIKCDEQTRKALLRGVEQLSHAVKATLGPGGCNVVISRTSGGPIVTKDGASVAWRRVLFLACVLLAFAVADNVEAEPNKGERIEHFRILWLDNPANEAVVSWTTRSPGTNHAVHFDTKSRAGDRNAYRQRKHSFRSGRYTMSATDEEWSKPGYYHHVHLTDLEPATTYHLVMTSGDLVSPEFHFNTAPADDRPFSVLFGGDSRIGGNEPYDHNDRQQMNLRMAALLEEHPDTLAFVHGGDYCQRAEWRYLDRWLTDHELTTTESGRLLPIVPARGNHDRQIGFEEMFSWPRRERDYYYSIQFSPAVALVTLNTEISVAGDQRRWLENELETLRPANRWLFAQYHRPAYSSVRSLQDGAPRRDNWVPLFERFNVDLVCESHDHALKRTLPIRSHAPDLENGIVYIGDGGLGVPQRTPDPNRWWLQEPGFATSAHHVHLLEFGEETLRVRALGMRGEVLDDFELKPRMVAVVE